MKKYLLFLFSGCLLSGGNIWAQDKVYLSNGGVINAKVKEVGAANITYKRYDNPDGPDYYLDKSEIEKIQYQNGATDNFAEAPRAMWDRRPGPPRRPMMRRIDTSKHYGPNVIAIAPLQLSENGIGVGASYERTLDLYGIVSLYIPLYLTFNVNNDSYNGYNDYNSQPMFYAAPGLKFYPTGNRGIVKYSIGPAFVFGTGRTNSDYYNYLSSYMPYDVPHTVFGVMVNNTLNINPSPKIYLGLELGLGGTYLNRVDGHNAGSTGLTQFAFRAGYRF